MGSWSGELAYDYELYFSAALRAMLDWGDDWPEPTLAQFLEMVHPDDRDRYVAMRDAALAGEAPYEIDCRFVTATGRVRHAHIAAEIERDDAGRPVRLIGIAQDITDSVRLIEQLLEAEAARRAVLHRLMQSADAERSRLALDLHDGPIQELTALALRLEHALGEDDVVAACHAGLASLRDVIASLRSTMSDLHPAVLGGRGIRATLEHLAATSIPDIDTSVEVEPAVELGEEVATTVVRVVQEALLNIRNHAHASRVAVHLRALDGHVLLEVVDDGRGFDPDGLPPPGHHLGLVALRERTEAADGELDIRSGPGGTHLKAWFPCG